ncbi:hypothetical protein CB1_000357011 [Camelus ferus]|nr:hypothetical protein CB1_000357011 [Camelus ferus]
MAPGKAQGRGSAQLARGPHRSKEKQISYANKRSVTISLLSFAYPRYKRGRVAKEDYQYVKTYLAKPSSLGN